MTIDSKSSGIESLKIVLFLESPTMLDAETLWTQMIGESPKSIEKKVAEGVTQATGEVEKFAITLALDPTRIDLTVIPKPPSPPVSDSPFSWGGDASEIYSFMNDCIEKALTAAPSLVRIGIVATSAREVDSERAAIDFVAGHVPWIDQSKIGSATELAIQYAEKDQLAEFGITVNNLHVWQVRQMQTFVISGSSMPKVSTALVVRRVLDVNNVVTENVSFDTAKAAALLRALSDRSFQQLDL